MPVVGALSAVRQLQNILFIAFAYAPPLPPPSSAERATHEAQNGFLLHHHVCAAAANVLVHTASIFESPHSDPRCLKVLALRRLLRHVSSRHHRRSAFAATTAQLHTLGSSIPFAKRVALLSFALTAPGVQNTCCPCISLFGCCAHAAPIFVCGRGCVVLVNSFAVL